MPQWYIFATVRSPEPITDSVFARFNGFRPEDDQQCIWVDEDDNNLLQVTTELPAPDSDTALDAGRDMAEQAIAVLSSTADVVEVGAEDVDDETSLSFLWTPPAQDR